MGLSKVMFKEFKIVIHIYYFNNLKTLFKHKWRVNSFKPDFESRLQTVISNSSLQPKLDVTYVIHGFISLGDIIYHRAKRRQNNSPYSGQCEDLDLSDWSVTVMSFLINILCYCCISTAAASIFLGDSIIQCYLYK